MSDNNDTLEIPSISISKESIFKFFRKYGVLLLLLIPVIISIYVRIQPESLPITDGWAQSSVNQYYRGQIETQIRQQYPNLPDANVNSLIDKQYTQFQSQNKANIQQQITQLSAQYKSAFQMDDGYTYMPDIDPYQWLRHAQNYLDHGYIGDIIVNGTRWDMHMTAPKGVILGDNEIHSVMIAYIYKIMHFFNSKITLMQAAAYHSVIFIALAVIPVFFIGRMLAGNLGGVVAGIVFAINGALLGRTTWGHADTDSYNVLFPMYFVWFFFLALRAKDTKKATIYGGLSGLSIGLFSIFWSGWWYIFDFALAACGGYLLYLIIFEHKFNFKQLNNNVESKHFFLAAISMILVSGILISIFVSPLSFLSSVTQPISFTNLKEASQANLWPNVYTTVAELNSASLSSIINSVGGNFFFYISLFGIVALFFMKEDDKRKHILPAIFFAIWYLGITYASTKGIRFTMMMTPPLALAFGAAVGFLYEFLVKKLSEMGIKKTITATVLIIVLVLFFFPLVKTSANAAAQEVPIANDAWYNVLTKIKTESQPNAIINSWWDFGHFFKYYADRAVTFDGATQNSPMAHWIGKALLTTNEQEAIGILRMVDCGSNDAFDILDSYVNDTSVSVGMLDDIIVLDKAGAQTYLANKKIPKNISDAVLAKTHCTPPEDYFITSDDMVGKGAVWAHFGSWDFDKADIWTQTKNLPMEQAIPRIKEQLKVTDDEAKTIYFQVKAITNDADANNWIAPWPGYQSDAVCSPSGNSTLICGGVKIDLVTKDVEIATNSGIKKPDSIGYVENGTYYEKTFTGGIGQSILLVPQGNAYQVVLSSPQLVSSMFTKLFFFNGAGTSHFKKFADERQITGGAIIAWKVAW